MIIAGATTPTVTEGEEQRSLFVWATILHDRNIQEWDFWMKRCCIDNTTGERYGWGRVLSYIGVPWDFDDQGNMIDLDGQIHLF